MDVMARMQAANARARTGLCVLGMIGALAGCGDEGAAAEAEAPQADDTTWTRVAEAVRGDVTVRYYVDSHGGLLETEQGSPAALAGSHRDLGPAERYASLTGQPAPSALVDAATRNHARGEPATQPQIFGALPIYREGVVAAADILRDGFIPLVCTPTDRNVQLLNQTAPVSYSKTDVNMWRAGVFVSSGVVLAQMQMDKRDPVVRLLPNQALILKYTVPSGRGYRAGTYVTLPEGPATFDVCINFHY